MGRTSRHPAEVRQRGAPARSPSPPRQLPERKAVLCVWTSNTSSYPSTSWWTSRGKKRILPHPRRRSPTVALSQRGPDLGGAGQWPRWRKALKGSPTPHRPSIGTLASGGWSSAARLDDFCWRGFRHPSVPGPSEPATRRPPSATARTRDTGERPAGIRPSARRATRRTPLVPTSRSHGRAKRARAALFTAIACPFLSVAQAQSPGCWEQCGSSPGSLRRFAAIQS
jgi:hypothetical protein